MRYSAFIHCGKIYMLDHNRVWISPISAYFCLERTKWVYWGNRPLKIGGDVLVITHDSNYTYKVIGTHVSEIAAQFDTCRDPLPFMHGLII